MDKEFLKSLATSQEAEQQAAGVRQLAAIVRLYHQELKAQGFSTLEALTLTSQMQAAILANAKQQGHGPA